LRDKVLFEIFIITLFLFVFNIVFPFEILMFLNQCNKETTGILIMWDKSHRILKTDFYCLLFSSWREKSLLDFRVFSILIFFIVFKFSFRLSFFIFLLFLNNTANFPIQQSSSTFYTIHIMDINNLKTFINFLEESVKYSLVFNGVQRTS